MALIITKTFYLFLIAPTKTRTGLDSHDTVESINGLVEVLPLKRLVGALSQTANSGTGHALGGAGLQ